MLKKGQCKDIDEEKRRFVRKLRNSIELLLDKTYVGLCTRKSYQSSPYINKYKSKREQMMRAGMPKSDIDYYDNRFSNLPWEIVGLESPQFDSL